MPPKLKNTIKLRVSGEAEVPLEVSGVLLDPRKDRRWFKGDTIHYVLRQPIFLDKWTYHLEIPIQFEVADERDN